MPINLHELQAMRVDFASVRGHPFRHFFCPITLEDTLGESGLINAHVLNGGIRDASRLKVIQRGDVDHYFGARIEPDFIERMNHDGYTDGECFNRAHETWAYGRSGAAFEVFIPGKGSKPRNIQIHLSDATGQIYASPYVKAPSDEFFGLTEIKIETRLKFRDTALTGTMLKSAYLCLFRTMGYRIIEDPLLNVVRSTLCEYFRARLPKGTAWKDFRSYEGAVMSLNSGPFDAIPDSLTGGHFLFHHVDEGGDEPGLHFGLSCIFHINGRTLAVMLPSSRYSSTNEVVIRLYRDFMQARDLPQVLRVARWRNDGWQVFDQTIRCSYVGRPQTP